MTTPSSPPLRSSPLMFREFQKVQENRRKISSLTKPHIRKLIGVQAWMCRELGGQVTGYGPTPTDAYRNWKAKQCGPVRWPEFCPKCGSRCEYSMSCNGCLNPDCNGPGQFG